MSPRPSIEKCPLLCMLGNTSFPGKFNFGGSFTMPKFSLRATIPTGFSAGRVATFTITFVLNMYDEKNTQNTSYNKSPVSNRVETFKLGNRTKAMNATHSPIPIAKRMNKKSFNFELNIYDVFMLKVCVYVNSIKIELKTYHPSVANDRLVPKRRQ